MKQPIRKAFRRSSDSFAASLQNWSLELRSAGDDSLVETMWFCGSNQGMGGTLMELDDKVCYCFRVSKRKLINFTRQTQPSRPSQLSECFGAGTGCGWCIPFLIRIHEQVMVNEVEKEQLELFEGSAEEYEQLRSTYQKDVKSGEQQKNRHGSAASPDAEDADFDGLL
ncbi:MAG: (2Fe-2S)-binding protein [Planctomycetota bacterium]